jgi:hypothetical protein
MQMVKRLFPLLEGDFFAAIMILLLYLRIMNFDVSRCVYRDETFLHFLQEVVCVQKANVPKHLWS